MRKVCCNVDTSNKKVGLCERADETWRKGQLTDATAKDAKCCDACAVADKTTDVYKAMCTWAGYQGASVCGLDSTGAAVPNTAIYHRLDRGTAKCSTGPTKPGFITGGPDKNEGTCAGTDASCASASRPYEKEDPSSCQTVNSSSKCTGAGNAGCDADAAQETKSACDKATNTMGTCTFTPVSATPPCAWTAATECKSTPADWQEVYNIWATKTSTGTTAWAPTQATVDGWATGTAAEKKASVAMKSKAFEILTKPYVITTTPPPHLTCSVYDYFVCSWFRANDLLIILVVLSSQHSVFLFLRFVMNAATAVAGKKAKVFLGSAAHVGCSMGTVSPYTDGELVLEGGNSMVYNPTSRSPGKLEIKAGDAKVVGGTNSGNLVVTTTGVLRVAGEKSSAVYPPCCVRPLTYTNVCVVWHSIHHL